MFKIFSSNTNENKADTNTSQIPDLETILKFKKIFDNLNSINSKNSPIINLLSAIKPFLPENQKPLIDQISKIISISFLLRDFQFIF